MPQKASYMCDQPLSTLEAATVIPPCSLLSSWSGRISDSTGTWRLYKWKAPTQPGVSTQWCHHLGGWCVWAWIEEFGVYNSGRLPGGWELWTQTPKCDLGAQLLATSPVPALPPVLLMVLGSLPFTWNCPLSPGSWSSCIHSPLPFPDALRVPSLCPLEPGNTFSCSLTYQMGKSQTPWSIHNPC